MGFDIFNHSLDYLIVCILEVIDVKSRCAPRSEDTHEPEAHRMNARPLSCLKVLLWRSRWELHAYIWISMPARPLRPRWRMPCEASWLNRSAILPANTGLANPQNAPLRMHARRSPACWRASRTRSCSPAEGAKPTITR